MNRPTWEARSNRRFTAEDRRQITENLAGFFEILCGWQRDEFFPDPTRDDLTEREAAWTLPDEDEAEEHRHI